MKNYNENTILKYVNSDLCCQTGICANICPTNSISMVYDKNGYLNPVVNKETCILCRKCLKVCPAEKQNLFDFIEEEKKSGKNFDGGYGSYLGIYSGYSKNDTIRQNASSGGILTHLLIHLLENKIVDAVITAKDKTSSIYGPWSEISLITNPDELLNSQSSKYYPLSYENYFNYIEKYKRVAVVAIPCVIYGLKKLHKVSNKKDNNIYLTPVCSHNVSNKLGTTLLKEQKFKSGELCSVNFRDKHNIPDQNTFNNKFTAYLNDGTLKKEISVNRFKNSFTFLWRNYFFSKKSCLFCPDFAGYMADAAFADAWGTPYVSDPKGNSLVVVRSKEIGDILLNLKDNEIVLREETIDTAIKSQSGQIKFKSVDYFDRVKLKDKKFISNVSVMLDYYTKIFAIYIGKKFKIHNQIYLLKNLFKINKFFNKIVIKLYNLKK